MFGTMEWPTEILVDTILSDPSSGKLIKIINRKQALDGKIRIETDELEKGCYLAKMIAGTETTTKKFIVYK